MHAAEAPLVVEDLQWRASLALTLRSVFRCRVIQPRALQRQEMAHPRGDVSIEPDETCPELRRVFPMFRQWLRGRGTPFRSQCPSCLRPQASTHDTSISQTG